MGKNHQGIIGIVINDHEKYEGHVLEDGFIASAINALEKEINQAGYFMMIKTMTKWDEIFRFASMGNMEGLVIIGFCDQDYKKLRESIHIPFVVYDGYLEGAREICNLKIDNYDGGYQVGTYLKYMGHKNVLCISDNFVCVDSERMDGCMEAFGKQSVTLMQIPFHKEDRMRFYQEWMTEILGFDAVFLMSDFYAVELMHILQERGVRIPEDISIVGFDGSFESIRNNPELTTVKQDVTLRARYTIEILQNLRAGCKVPVTIKIPVSLVRRQSVKENIHFLSGE